MNQTHKQQESDNLTRFADGLVKFTGSLFLLSWHGTKRFLGLSRNKPIEVSLWFLASSTLIYAGVQRAWHLRFMQWIWPSAFSGKFLDWLYRIPIATHFKFVYFTSLLILVVILGAGVLRRRAKLRECFEAIGLKNGIGLPPALAWHSRVDEFTEKYGFYSKGIGLEQFQSKKSALESILGIEIESILIGKTPSIVVLTTTTKVLPGFVSFSSLRAREELPDESFYVGDSKRGIIYAKLKDLPHLLIAGTTGGGKSIFFKQVVAGLLKSSPCLQVYLIDLKRGLEAKDFEGTPNVAIAKDIHEAVIMLEAVHKNMEKRFKFLEQKGLKSIESGRDRLDRIVVAVDEASELYAEKSKFDDDYELVERAQKITNSIARLGRAAGIHLILATQKVNKESINTVIQENLSARLCFKMNTLQGSLQMLGSKDALDLPVTRGRAIWQHGTEQVTVQVPFIDKTQIDQVTRKIKGLHEEGEIVSMNPMLVGPEADDYAQGAENSARETLVDIDA